MHASDNFIIKAICIIINGLKIGFTFSPGAFRNAVVPERLCQASINDMDFSLMSAAMTIMRQIL
jgi:hypothetical protein